MKFQMGTLLVAALAITSVSSFVANSKSVAESISDDLTTPLHNILARTISEQVVLRLEQHFRDEADRQSRATLIPPVDDPICVEPAGQPINISIGDPNAPLATILGHANLTEPLIVNGLSEIVDDFNIKITILPPGINIGWDFGVPAIDVNGAYDAMLTLEVPSTDIVNYLYGSGDLTASVKNVFFNFLAKGGPTLQGKLALRELEVDLGFSDFAVNGGNASLDGENPFDWDALSTGINELFTAVWTEETKANVTEAIKCSLNYVVGDCGFDSFPNVTDCLRFNLTELLGECFSDDGNEGSSVEYSLMSLVRSVSIPWANTCADTGNTGSTTPSDESSSTTPSDESSSTTPSDESSSTTPSDESSSTTPSDESSSTTPSDESSSTTPSDESSSTTPSDESSSTTPSDESSSTTPSDGTGPSNGTGSTPGGSTAPTTEDNGGSSASNWSAPISNLVFLLTVFTSVYRL